MSLISALSHRFGVRFEVTDGQMGGVAYRGAHQPDGTILISRNATQDEVLHKTLIHELAHQGEGGKSYGKFAEELLQIAYGDNLDQLKADMAELERRYRAAKGDKYEAGEEFCELVATKAEEILGNEDFVNRLAAKKPSIAARIWQTLKDFVKKITGMKSTEADRIRRAEQLYRKALEEAGKARQTVTGAVSDLGRMQVEQHMPENMQFALKPGQVTENGASIDQYTESGYNKYGWARFHNIISPFTNAEFQRHLKGKVKPFVKGRTADGFWIVETGREFGIGNTIIITDGNKKAPSIERVYQISYNSTDTAEFAREIIYDAERKLGQKTLDFVKGIAGLADCYDRGDFPTYDELSAQVGRTGLRGVRWDNSGDHSKRSEPGSRHGDGPQYALGGITLPSPEIRRRMIAEHHARMSSPPAPPGADGQQNAQPAGNMGERQFNAQTAQRSPALPVWLKQVLWQNRWYERDTNRAQAERAWERISSEGYVAARDRLMNMRDWGTDENVEALILLHMALRPVEQGGMGDPELAMEIALRDGLEGTKQGQALQARKLFNKLNPTGMYVWAAGSAEAALQDYLAKHLPAAKQAKKQAAQLTDELSGLDGTDPLAPDSEGNLVITPEATSRWGLPINERQQALIDHYHLGNIARPGLYYNKATTRQRMLEAILATPDPTAQTGLGMNLIERLELMESGAPVVTEADLTYIVDQMQAYVATNPDGAMDMDNRLGDLALARAYEAYGNITPATLREKARTWRYTSMLLSIPSATRNIIGNAVQGATNATSHGVAVLLDQLVSGVTGERTVALNSMQERADGWHAFVTETVNTFRDYFVDHAETRRGNDRYGMHQRGRVFQGAVPEALRTLEGFLMSVGDRNVWRKAYVQSMAEQARVAQLNGVEFDPDAAAERAMADANYATYSEDNAVSTALSALKQIPVIGDLCDFIIPFTGVPTNIVKRMGQYSPFGLAWNVARAICRAATHQTFDQHGFVTGIARGLTGTAMFAAGALLYSLGVIKLGTGEEEDKEYALHTAMGQQYAPYIQIGDQTISLSVLAPAISPFIMSATAFKCVEEAGAGNLGNALLSAAIAAGDQVFDASYMANLSDIFGGYGSPTENLLVTVGSSMISQNIPSILGQWASALDPYVRDTRDRNKLVEIVNKGLINKLPWLRHQLLPAKVDVAGRRVENTDYGPWAFIDPFNRSRVPDDPALQELDRLHDSLGVTSFLPSDALSGTKTSLSGVAAPVEGEDKEAYRVRYGELWRLGGDTYDAEGNRVTIMGVTEMIQQPWYQRMTDAQKAEALSGVMAAAKAGATYETGEKLGHTPKSSSSSSSGYTPQPVRAVPDRLAGRYPQLDAKFRETGDGTYIPKGISGSFSRGGVQYDLTGKDYDRLWDRYIVELDAEVADIVWTGDPEEDAAAVNSAYSRAAKNAKDWYVKGTD